jgi:hypothetical protein
MTAGGEPPFLPNARSAGIVDDDAYTNAAAAKLLEFCEMWRSTSDSNF